MRAAFVFDQDRCTGCEACRIACGIENGGGRDLAWRQIHTLNPAHHPALPTKHLSLACNHCERPACLLGCPAAAYRRDTETGAVLLDSDKCIGCRYCSWVCPYDVPRFDEALGVMTKCTFCSHRLAEGKAPACAQACPTGALSHSARPETSMEPDLLGLPSLAFGPALIVKRSVASETEKTATLSHGGAGLPRGAQPIPKRKILLRSEWGLVVFTTVLPFLVAWFAAGLLDPSSSPPALVIAGAGGLAMAVSTLHLGKPFRAWRAILNPKTSWLSREILLSSGFLAAATLARLLPVESSGTRWLGIGALLAGVGTVLAIDALYRQIPFHPVAGPRFDAAETWLTALFLAGIFAGSAWLWLPSGFLKLAFSLSRRRRFDELETGTPRWLPPWRKLLLLLGCLAVSMPGSEPLNHVLGIALATAGEVLDRCRFYLELEPVSPGRILHAAALGFLPVRHDVHLPAEAL